MTIELMQYALLACLVALPVLWGLIAAFWIIGYPIAVVWCLIRSGRNTDETIAARDRRTARLLGR